jgi:hypothetical protein
MCGTWLRYIQTGCCEKNQPDKVLINVNCGKKDFGAGYGGALPRNNIDFFQY